MSSLSRMSARYCVNTELCFSGSSAFSPASPAGVSDLIFSSNTRAFLRRTMKLLYVPPTRMRERKKNTMRSTTSGMSSELAMPNRAFDMISIVFCLLSFQSVFYSVYYYSQGKQHSEHTGGQCYHVPVGSCLLHLVYYFAAFRGYQPEHAYEAAR